MTAVLWWTVQDENRNEQRQGITMVVISCLLCYMARLRAIAAYVRTGRMGQVTSRRTYVRSKKRKLSFTEAYGSNVG